MKRKSLRQLARELGVSPSYLSQVKNGKRPASDKVLSNPDVLKLLNVKQKVDDDAILSLSQRSSGVEQRFRKPPVVSSNLTAGCI